MTIDELITALRDSDAALYVDDGGQLRYVGARLELDDPIRQAIAEHRPLLTELFAFAPRRRCIFKDCYRLVAECSKLACPDHLRQLDDSPYERQLELAS